MTCGTTIVLLLVALPCPCGIGVWSSFKTEDFGINFFVSSVEYLVIVPPNFMATSLISFGKLNATNYLLLHFFGFVNELTSLSCIG